MKIVSLRDLHASAAPVGASYGITRSAFITGTWISRRWTIDLRSLEECGPLTFLSCCCSSSSVSAVEVHGLGASIVVARHRSRMC